MVASLTIQAPRDIRVAGAFARDWYDTQWTVAYGCRHISPGCKHCSAELLAPPGGAIKRSGRWTGAVVPLPAALGYPARWTKPMRVFVGSMTDLWYDGFPADFRLEVWEKVLAYPQHTFAFLSKHAHEMVAWFLEREEIPANVFVGVSVENADYLWRAEALAALRGRVAVRYMQCEPLLGPIDAGELLDGGVINWVLAGPEWGCGDDARPCDAGWMRSLMNQCERSGVPFFTRHLLDGRTIRQVPHGT